MWCDSGTQNEALDAEDENHHVIPGAWRQHAKTLMTWAMSSEGTRETDARSNEGFF